MKKIFKGIAILAAMASVGAGASFVAGCGEKTVTGEAFGTVHGGHYVGRATVTVKGSKVSAATLEEVCFPDQVTVESKTGASREEAVDKLDETNKANPDYVVIVTVKGTTYTAKLVYKTVKYGNVTITAVTGDETTSGYKVGSVSIHDYMNDVENAKAYYNAVMANDVAVVVGGAEKKNVLTKKTLSKEENGYWTNVKDANGNSYSRWIWNRDATCKYVVDNGVEKLLSLVRSTAEEDDGKGTKGKFWKNGDVSTGATWSDLNNSAADGYVTYAQLLVNAYNASQGVYVGSYSYNNPWKASEYYGMRVRVTVANGKITKVEDITATDSVSSKWAVVSDGWTDKAKWNDGKAKLLEKYNGLAVADVLAIKSSVKANGEPENVDKNADANGKELVITGSTQGSIRLLLAVQNALKQVK